MTIVANRWSARLALAICFCLPFLLLGPFRSAGPVADDFYFARTPFSLAADDLAANREWRHDIAPNVRGYRPLTTASYAVDQRVGNGSPTIFHLTNFALHGLAASLVAALIMVLVGSTMAGFVAGVLFAVHPVHHENVVWISGRTFPLAAIFFLTALLLTARRCVQAETAFDPSGAAPQRARRIGRFVGALALGACALASYEAAVTLPLAVFTLALFVRPVILEDRDPSLVETVSRALRPALPYVLVTAAYLVLRWLLLSSAASEASAYGGGRVVRNGLAVVSRLLAMPRLGHAPIVGSVTFWASACLALLTIVAGLWSSSSRRIVLWALAFAGLAYLPFIALPGYSDRFLYLTSAGFVIAVAAGAWEWWQRGGAWRASMAIVLSVVAGLWSAQLVRAGGQWMEAGALAESLAAQLRRELPAPPVGARLGFLCVPEFHGTAYVYYTYFEAEMVRTLRRPDVAITKFPRGTSEGTARVDYLFRWLDRERRLELVRRPGDAPIGEASEALACQPEPLLIKP